MKRLISAWCGWFGNLLGDDLISYYVFFTTILAEIAYLWSAHQDISSVFTWILLGCIANVLLTAFLKGSFETTKTEKVISYVYVVIFATLFIIGAVINIWASLVFVLFPFLVTLMFINVRELQYCSGKTFEIIGNIIIVGIPFAAFVIAMACVPGLSLVLKILLPIVYFLLIPLIVWIEDSFATCNIFELFYEHYL